MDTINHWAETLGEGDHGVQPTQASPAKLKRKWNAIPPGTLNADPLAQFIGTDTIAKALIDDIPTKVLLDMRATIDLMPISYAKAEGLENQAPLSDCRQTRHHESCCRPILRSCQIHRVQSESTRSF